MSLPVLVAFVGVLVTAVATGTLAGRCVREPRAFFVAWTGAALGLTVAVAAQAVGFANGFGPVTFRATQLGAQLIAPVWLAWGLVEVVCDSRSETEGGGAEAARFGARLISIAVTVVAGLVLATDSLGKQPFSKAWPSASEHYQSISHLALNITQVLALAGGGTAVMVAAARSRTGPAWRGALPGVVPVGLALLVAVALRFSLPDRSAYPLVSMLAAGLIWFGTTASALTIGGHVDGSLMGPDSRGRSEDARRGDEGRGYGDNEGYPQSYEGYPQSKEGYPPGQDGYEGRRRRDQQGAEGGYGPEAGHAPGYRPQPQPGHGPQPGYGPQPGHGPQAGYGSQHGYGPQPGYGPGHAPQPGYGPQPGHDPRGGNDLRGRSGPANGHDQGGGHQPMANQYPHPAQYPHPPQHPHPSQYRQPLPGQFGQRQTYPQVAEGYPPVTEGYLADGRLGRYGGPGTQGTRPGGTSGLVGHPGSTSGRPSDPISIPLDPVVMPLEPVAEFTGDAKTAATPARPYGRILIFTLLDDKAADFDQLAEQTAEEVRTGEPDTLVYVIHLVPNAPMQRIFYEIYRDRAAFDSHENKSYVQRFVTERRAYVLATNVIELRVKYAKVAPLTADPRPLSVTQATRPQLPPGQGPTAVGLPGQGLSAQGLPAQAPTGQGTATLGTPAGSRRNGRG